MKQSSLGRFSPIHGMLLALLLMNSLAVAGEAPVSPNGLSEVDRLVEQGIAEQQMPGAVVMIGTRDTILHYRAYGNRQLLPNVEPMTLDTVFDLASLTKPLATGISTMLFFEQGKLRPESRVGEFFAEFNNRGKERITIAHLLTHTSGLTADNALRDYTDGPAAAWERICELPLTAPVGEKFTYSDVGFIVLGKIIEHLSGQSLDEFTRTNIYIHLKMLETGYLPREQLQQRAAPADRRGQAWVRGTVHDPRADALGGIAGHAGLFSTAKDLSRLARMILQHGSLEGVRVLQPETIDAMLTSRPIPGAGLRTWGWDRQTGFSSNKGEGMSELAIGHGGFTGTGIWIDPKLDLYVIFLSNRLHPDGKGAVNRLIGDIGTVAVKIRRNSDTIR